MEALGAEHQRIAALWEDTGDAENGPDLSGCQAHDYYLLDGIEYAVFEDGTTDWSPESPPPFA